jgi:DNA/RNA endonuclease YhcR with UshA esterase domain
MTIAVLLAFTLIARADDPAKPKATEIDAADKAALDAAANKDVVVTGTVKKAKWSGTGKVMTVEFEDSPLLAAVFEKTRDAVNAANDGDAAKKWTGAKVKLKGKLGKYGGPQKSYQDRPQIVITKPDQLTVVEAKKD